MNSKPFLRRHSNSIQSLLLTAIVFALGFAVGNLALSNRSNAQGRGAITDTDQAFKPFWDAFEIVESRYVDPVNVEILVDGAIDGMVDALEDDHSGYIRPDLCDRVTNFPANSPALA